MIELSNIEFGYTKRRILFKDLNITMTPGHIYGLLGKNGSGKTTLLKIMTGLCFPQKGIPLILGSRAEKRYPEVLSNVYFLPEELYTPHLKLKDYLKIYAPFYPHFNQEQFEYYLHDFEIENYDGYIDKLSHGQKKKIHIAFALSANTQILFMDEPTNGLDIPSKGQFRRMVASVLDENRCIIISTHQVRDLDNLIDNLIIMDNHEIALNESIETITDRLFFRLQDADRNDLPVIYSEDTLRGVFQVCENVNREDSKLDIELLFNAVYRNKKQIQQIFNTK